MTDQSPTLAFVFSAVVAKVQPGVNPIDICREGDKLIEEKVGKIFNKKVRLRHAGLGLVGGRPAAVAHSNQSRY